MSTHRTEYRELQARIRAVMNERKIFAKEIAHALGVSLGYVGVTLAPSGNRGPTLLKRIAAYLGIE